MANNDVCLGLDVGERRIGVAIGDTAGRLASPLTTLTVDGSEAQRLQTLLSEHSVTRLVVGLPRNASGSETKQSQFVREFVDSTLQPLGLPVALQDESVTSIIAEERLAKRKKSYKKADIDAEAAAIILQDYLEGLYAGY